MVRGKVMKHSNSIFGRVQNYRRWLDLDNALAGSSYDTTDGSSVNKTAFCSYPDQVCAFNVATNMYSSLNYTVNFYNDDTASPHATCIGGNGLLLRGKAEETANAMDYEGQVVVTAQGGSVSCKNGVLTVQGAKQFTAILSTGTNYDQDNGNEEANFSFKGADPHALVTQNVKKAASKAFSVLQRAHIADYSKLYGGFKLTWNAKSPGKPTDEQVAEYRINPNDPHLEWLVQFSCFVYH